MGEGERALAFIRPELPSDPIVIDRVSEILPRLEAAVAPLSEKEKHEAAPSIQRM